MDNTTKKDCGQKNTLATSNKGKLLKSMKQTQAAYANLKPAMGSLKYSTTVNAYGAKPAVSLESIEETLEVILRGQLSLIKELHEIREIIEKNG